MKLVIIGLVALVILGGGGAGAYFYFSKTAEAALVEGEVKPGEDKHKKDDKHADKEGHPAIFVQIDPLVLPIIDHDGVSQVISLVIMVEVADEESAAKVKSLSPRLKDAFIQDMYGVLNKPSHSENGLVQVADIKKRLNDISQRVMGEDVVQDVLLQVVEQRPL